MRWAETPWGPWSEGTVIFDPGRDSGYGHFMHMASKFKKNADALSDSKEEESWGGECDPYMMVPISGDPSCETMPRRGYSRWPTRVDAGRCRRLAQASRLRARIAFALGQIGAGAREA
ncbi:hypothetical protein AYO44_16660 [Planctomycetaceae bacterium SCGC AG-212-F19]|nr:hypothetical protein AYO44_16660 [Planctomycetaceae bacterium SCGC AG-212-F19]